MQCITEIVVFTAFSVVNKQEERNVLNTTCHE